MDGDTVGLDLIGLVTFVCFLRGTGDLVASGLVTFGGVALLLGAVVSSGAPFFNAWSALVRSLTSSNKRSDIVDGDVDTVDNDAVLLTGDIEENCFGVSAEFESSESFTDGVATGVTVILLNSPVCALVMLAEIDREPVVAERGDVCCV